MIGFWATHRRKGICGLGGLLVAAGIGTLNVAAQTTTSHNYDDPVDLFAEMMPVFRSPRCVNCHGGTDPNPKPDGLNHEAGQVDVAMDGAGNMNVEGNGACVECHSVPAAKNWHLAPLPMSFVGKDTPLQMCVQMRSFNTLADPSNRQPFLDHLQTDPLIGLAFEGKGGIGDETAFGPITPEPPSMSRQAFLASALRWLSDGEAACKNEWSGTITETSTMTQSEKFAPAPGGREVGAETTIAITVVKNKATADVHVAMHDFTDVPLKECQTFVHLTRTAVDNNLPVDLTIALNTPKVSLVITAPAGSEAPPGFLMPPGFEFPPGFELPPGVTLPPGGFELPPGMTLPPEVTVPGAPRPDVGPFFMYGTTGKNAVNGSIRIDTRSMPGCKQGQTNTQQPYYLDGALVEVKVDPKSPNHLSGERETAMPGGKRLIKWDLTHVVE